MIKEKQTNFIKNLRTKTSEKQNKEPEKER